MGGGRGIGRAGPGDAPAEPPAFGSRRSPRRRGIPPILAVPFLVLALLRAVSRRDGWDDPVVLTAAIIVFVGGVLVAALVVRRRRDQP